MKKKIFVILSGILLIISCEIKRVASTENNPIINESITDKENRVVEDKNGRKMLFGEINEKAFSEEPFSTWYKSGYADYTAKQVELTEVKKKFKAGNYKIEIFIGTWCPDSRREVPHFMKILNETGFSQENLLIYALDASKKSFKGEEVGKNIGYVPTFIVYKNEKEIGRIIESPIETLEEDLLKILNTNSYIPNNS